MARVGAEEEGKSCGAQLRVKFRPDREVYANDSVMFPCSNELNFEMSGRTVGKRVNVDGKVKVK